MIKDQIREDARYHLFDLLKSFEGDKTIVWDRALMNPMEIIVTGSEIKEYGLMKILGDERGSSPGARRNIIFLVRPTLTNMDLIADYIKQGSDAPDDYHIICVPRKSILCEERLFCNLENQENISFHSLPIYLFPMNYDLFSMEITSSFKEIVDEDSTSLQYAAMSLKRIQEILGVIPEVYGKGIAARKVFEIMEKKKKEAFGTKYPTLPTFDSMVLIDRSVDLISPLPTQYTYEGLLDEMIGIECGVLNIADEEGKEIKASSSEELYQELQGLHFNAVGSILKEKLDYIKSVHEKTEELSIQEIKELTQGEELKDVKKIKPQIDNHTALTKILKKGIKNGLESVIKLEHLIIREGSFGGLYKTEVEDLVMADTVPVIKIIRLICLQSVVCGGLNPQEFEKYRRLLLENYGYNILLTLDAYSDAGLLITNTKKSSFKAISDRLGLRVDKVDYKNPEDIAYVHTMYAPLSVKIVQHTENSGWNKIKDILDLLPGPTFEESQEMLYERDRKIVLVYFIGGVTMAEIAALRFLSKQEDSNVKYIIFTTSIITGDRLIRSLDHNLPKNPEDKLEELKTPDPIHLED